MYDVNYFNKLSWKSLKPKSISSKSFSQLLNNELPFLRVPAFISEGECASVISAIGKHPYGMYDKVEPRIDRIGCTVFEFHRSNSLGYYKKGEELRSVRQSIFDSSVDLLQRFQLKMHECIGKTPEIAKSESGDEYYAGLFRKIENGTELHIDFSPVEQSGWEICSIEKQLAVNIYLDTCYEETGATTVYERQWREGDTNFKSGSYGYSDQVLSGSRSVTFHPRVGDLIIFNTRNYHMVEKSKNNRLTFSSALGEMPNGNLILWS